MWTLKKSRKAIRAIRPYARNHRRWLVRGIIASAGVVLFRLAMPWPLRWIMEIVFPHKAAYTPPFLPGWGDPVLWFCGLYVLLAVGAGINELIQRVNMKRFAAHAVHDFRAAAVLGATRQGAGAQQVESGELIARIIGDSARIKAGLSGILVHVVQNGLLFLGICVLLFCFSFQLGTFYLAAGLLATAIGLRASTHIADTSRKHRKKEGAYAVTIMEALEYGEPGLADEDINLSSARKEVRATKLVSISTLLIHAILAVIVAVALWVGATAVQAGQLAPGELFLFVAYVITMHRRLVQIGRQAARGGKILPCLRRIGDLLDTPGVSVETKLHEPLRAGLRFESVRLDSARGKDNKARIRQMDLTIQAGSRVAVLGKVASGKSSLLRLMAGVEQPSRGKIFWDEQILQERPRMQVGYLPQDPVFSRRRVWQILRLPASDKELRPDQVETLQKIGLWRIISKLPKELNEKVASAELSRGERRAFALGAIVLGDDTLWLLDDPLEGLAEEKARDRLEEILARATGRTLVTAFSRPVALERFDRVLTLRRGRISFDSTPAQWEETECRR